MKYSLLDAFLIWVGGPWLLVGAVAFIAAVFAFVWSFQCHLKNEIRHQAAAAKSEKAWEEELKHRSLYYQRVRAIRQAKEAEERRIEKAKDDCLANSTRCRYSKQIVTLP